MMERLPFLWPEIVLFATTCIVMVVGLSPKLSTRKLTAVLSGVGLLAAGLVAYKTPHGEDVVPQGGQTLLPNLAMYGKVLTAGIGLLLLLVMTGTVDRREEELVASGRVKFDPLRSNRAEFYSFFLFSLTGLMLCAGADDLIWLFLALELTSLPTYIMVTISSSRGKSREAGVKYFFLGALGAAIFLYGFAMIYGGTGTTNLNAIASVFARDGINPIAMAGLVLAIVGMSFKIAAVPMHFYTADVYEGAAAPVSAFLAFVPKAAGFFAILLIVATAGWGDAGLPPTLRIVLWVLAAMTMTVGNILTILQSSVKRILAYSSIAHSGYMLVGVVAGPGDGSFSKNGVAAVLFYLLAYGVMNLGAFAVIAAVERSPGPDGEPQEVDSVEDLRGLCATRPALGWVMVLCSLSLLGFPPLLGFFGKLPLFTSAIAADEILLVIVLGLNSAIAAFYYLRLMAAPLLEKAGPAQPVLVGTPFASRKVVAIISGVAVLILAVPASTMMEWSRIGGEHIPAAAPRSRGLSPRSDERAESVMAPVVTPAAAQAH